MGKTTMIILLQEPITESTIWSTKSYHPEYVIEDARIELGLSADQCAKLRFILLKRGVNKALYCRFLFICLKHRLKGLLFGSKPITRIDMLKVYARMQEITKVSRWIEWDQHIHKKMKDNIEKCIIKGKRS